MFLKNKNTPFPTSFTQKTLNWFSLIKKKYSKKKIVLSLMLLFFLAAYSCFLIFVGGFLQSSGFHYKILKPALLRSQTTLVNYYRSIITDIDHIHIDIKHKDFMKLEYARKLAIQSGTLRGVTNEYVNGKIRHLNETTLVKLRLRGSTANDHQATDKWSMRIKAKGDATLFGVKTFSLMDPARRNFMNSWFLRKVMRKEGVVSKRYKFVGVSINGTWKGIYALDEYYDKYMLENNHRREGPIIRFEQEPIFSEKPLGTPSSWDDFYDKLDITTFNPKKLFSNKILFEQFKHASNLLQAFRLGELKTKEVFDIEKLAKWMAIGDLLGGWHGFTQNNMRFYYNPITSRLEPVPDDHFNEFTKERIRRLPRLEDEYTTGKFVKTMFEDLHFEKQYGKELERISKKEYLDNLLKELDEEIRKNLAILHNDRSLLWYLFPADQFYKNQNKIRLTLNPYKAIQVFIEKISSDSITLSAANNEKMSVEITNLSLKGKNLVSTSDTMSIVLRGREMGSPPKFSKFKFPLPKNINIKDDGAPILTVSYRLLGTSKTRNTSAFPYPGYDKRLLKGGIPPTKRNFKNFPFLKIDTKKKLLVFKKGNIKLEQDFVVPKGFKVILNSGVTLDMVKSSKILSYSPIQAVGTEGLPVVITSSDETGQGITVINVQEESIFKNVIFQNLSPPSNERWKLTGSLNFYESPVEFYKTTFSNNKKGDDFLNIIRSKFIIRDSQFNKTFADALDSDFSSGKIENTSFQNCGASGENGDGIDLSGSFIEIENIIFEDIADKALSIGENSLLQGDNIEIKNSKIAIANKDSSYSKINNVRINDSKIGLAVFQKKSEYGPSRLEMTSLNIAGVDKPYLVESESTLFIEGAEIKSNSLDLREYLYTQK